MLITIIWGDDDGRQTGNISLGKKERKSVNYVHFVHTHWTHII